MKRFGSIGKMLFTLCIVATLFSCAGAPSGDIGAPQGAARKIDIWDFGGVETVGEQYVNNITRTQIDALQTLVGGKFTAGEITFGDLILLPNANDRLYYYTADGKNGKKSAGNQGYDSVVFPDGYESRGIFYCNGTGGEDRRYIIINNVKAGDTITFYGITSNSSETNLFFANIDAENKQTGLQTENAKMMQKEACYEYVAKADGSYKIFTEKAGGKPCYYRVVRTPSVFVSGKVSVPGALKEAKFGLNFVNQATSAITEAKVDGTSFGVSLAPGFSYTAVLTGATGFGINDETKVVSVLKDSVIKGLQSAKLTAAAQSVLTAKGTISGFEPSYDVSKLAVTLMPPKDTLFQPAKLKLEGMNFSGTLEPNVKYTASLEGANDYFITAGAEFNAGSDFTQDIKVGLKPKSKTSGKFIGAVANKKISAVTFKNIDDEYTYAGTVDGNSFAGELRNGAYTIDVGDNYTCEMHIVIDGSTVIKDILVHEKDVAKETLPLAKSLYVGYKNKKGSYATLGQAVKAAAAMNPQSEKDRITIYIAPGVYREQVRISTPYITLKNETSAQEAKLTWYYGIGYKYYSANKEGFYSDDCKLDRYEKRIAARWGVATQVLPDAKYFRAEGITFEASFNKYITDEELADGVESDGSMNYIRRLTSDVRSAKAKERSSAICVESAYSEFYNCKFIGNQDTLFTGSGVPQYYKNCYIEGTTDYIFGEGDVVFDTCELCWCGAPDLAAEGHIAVAKSGGEKGYLFWNCSVSTLDGMKMGKADFGRPWEQAAKVAFINTRLDRTDSIMETGWGNMSGNTPDKATFREFGSTYNGTPINTSKRVKGTVLTDAAKYTPEAYFIGWTPVFYQKAPTSKPSFAAKPSITSDDDINTPYPGHTLTVRYELDKASVGFDTSLIRWTRIKDGKETLAKVGSGNGSKTYLLKASDEGCTIRVDVILETASKNKGETASAKLDAKVLKGFSTAAKANDQIGIREDGKINIFLAGDSTVKDYSKAGMYQAGVNRDEGSWGEYLGYFFNNKKAVVQNYANGGRSTRNFINEGTLDKIAKQIKKGDYLFIQFGHNDSSNTAGYLEDRHVPLGAPDAKGIFPTTAGKKSATPASYADRYGPEFYAWNCGGTYKWFLKQYIDVARKVGAIPVLVTPVSRLNFQGDKIRPHHDSVDKNSPSQPVSTNNSYVQAVLQLGQEEKVAVLDAFDITVKLYEGARAKGKKYPPQLFGSDTTHNNKLGGFIIAGLIAQDLKARNWDISKFTAKPVKIIGDNAKGMQLFTVGVSSTFYAFESGMNEKYEKQSAYWTEFGQNLINSFGK